LLAIVATVIATVSVTPQTRALAITRGGPEDRGSLSSLCYRGRGDDSRSCRQDEPWGEGAANYCTTNCTLAAAGSNSAESLAKSIR
jgi:hypothetical protein